MIQTSNFKRILEQHRVANGFTTSVSDIALKLRGLEGSEFWLWGDQSKHVRRYRETGGRCCFNHQIGLPVKNNVPRPLYNWQKEIYDAFVSDEHKLVAILKSRSIGASELCLRVLLWEIVKDRKLAGKNIILVTGIRENLAVDLLNRFKALLPWYDWNTKETVASIGDVHLECFPSKRVKDLRGITSVSHAVVEESSFYDPAEQEAVLPTLEALRTKSDCRIWLISSPGQIGSLMHKIYQEPESRYFRLHMPYIKALGTLFSQAEIDAAKKMPHFEIEMNLEFGSFGSGNLINVEHLHKALDQGRRYADPKYNPDCVKLGYPHILPSNGETVIGVDPGAGSSQFAIVAATLWDRKIHIQVAQQFEHPLEDQMVEYIKRLHEGTHRTANIFVDASAVSFIRNLKSKIVGRNGQKDPEMTWHLEYLRQNNISDEELPAHQIVVAVPFGKYGPVLAQRLALYFQRGMFCIHPSFKDLIQQLGAARLKANVSHDFMLDKSTQSLDLVDAMRLCMFDYR